MSRSRIRACEGGTGRRAGVRLSRVECPNHPSPNTKLPTPNSNSSRACDLLVYFPDIHHASLVNIPRNLGGSAVSRHAAHQEWLRDRAPASDEYGKPRELLDSLEHEPTQ